MEPDRIETSDGNWVEVRTVVTRGMRKLFRAAALAGFLHTDGAQVDLTDSAALQAHIMAHPEQWDLNAVDDAYLLHGITAWSYKGPVTLKALDGLPAADMDRVLERLREIYAEPSAETVKN